MNPLIGSVVRAAAMAIAGALAKKGIEVGGLVEVVEAVAITLGSLFWSKKVHAPKEK